MSAVHSTRREFLKGSVALGAGIVTVGPLGRVPVRANQSGSKMKFGLVTYLWGQDWNLPTLIANCERTGVLGLELRTQHAHGVEANLSQARRREVKKRFADSPVTLMGPGTNFAFHYPDEDRLKQEIEGAKQYIKLSYDCGGSGVKVKPTICPKGCPMRRQSSRLAGRSTNWGNSRRPTDRKSAWKCTGAARVYPS